MITGSLTITGPKGVNVFGATMRPGDALAAIVREERAAMGAAIRKGVERQAIWLQAEMRRQVSAGGWKGNVQGLRNAWRYRIYENADPAKAAGFVYSKAPRIMRAAEEGGTARAKGGKYLIIPLPGARRSRGGTPKLANFIGQKGVAIVRGRRGRLYVVKRTRTRTTFLFLLVRQVTHRKRIDFAGAASRAVEMLPAAIAAAWPK